ncbi:SDR family oxidoreductase [Xylella taiwanensis]|uniref:3-alpha-hydroxysteroid dehydrogenase n=1 Tax=Xylella taiwanensis TaxID=1444770 RepID=Z9JJL5_9GAMM|nr:coniferyl-alcohol dehydrogenase [Xylella taiwanensis]AXI83782.1 3-alpha-hydroxysteroid dehydrogenase [Xylella taiwanensis]EWS78173.1 3-alpha-hydroxysteroid dehydrogenase [Xylella taiwanensis]MCD8456887.1 coniferyl-alcohol dehydrogenase [Xylella taiwanensis]MCD8459299.1 coniferyl-alcohol dehydrogenase [Xylella taiwanensis]MCD8461830.1 coniferyl-alcohol dehydrogenase [Xylella taiwanensis]
MNLHNKTVLITGVASGIGAEVARLARFQGATVIGIDCQPVTMTLHGFHHADLGDPASMDTLIAQLPERVDVLANIAGVPGTAPVDVVAKVNYLGLRHLSHALLPRIAPGGSVINMTSLLGAEWPQRLELHKQLASTPDFAAGLDWLAAHPVPASSCYQYFKEALIVWTMLRSRDWFAEHAVRVNSVAPGPVFTPILGDFATMLGPERVQADAAKMKRPAYADEVAEAVVFLASDAARWINGVNLPVDGGFAAAAI